MGFGVFKNSVHFMQQVFVGDVIYKKGYPLSMQANQGSWNILKMESVTLDVNFLSIRSAKITFSE